MRSICLFSSYFTGSEVPYYVRYYLDDLSSHFSEVCLLTNEKKLSEEAIGFLTKRGIGLKLYDNEGMDFGMWKKAMSEIECNKYDRIGLVNDSCVLYSRLDGVFQKATASNADVFGLVLTGKISPHLQSYFILLNKKAIQPAASFFRTSEIGAAYKQIIFESEIGLSSRFMELGLKIEGYFDFSKNTTQNPSFVLAKELISLGSPMIKKKLLNRNFRAGDYLTWMRNKIDIDSFQYLELIQSRNAGGSCIDMDKVMKELTGERSRMDVYIFRLVASLYQVFKKVGLFRFIFRQLINLKRFLKK